MKVLKDPMIWVAVIIMFAVAWFWFVASRQHQDCYSSDGHIEAVNGRWVCVPNPPPKYPQH